MSSLRDLIFWGGLHIKRVVFRFHWHLQRPHAQDMICGCLPSGLLGSKYGVSHGRDGRWALKGHHIKAKGAALRRKCIRLKPRAIAVKVFLQRFRRQEKLPFCPKDNLEMVSSHDCPFMPPLRDFWGIFHLPVAHPPPGHRRRFGTLRKAPFWPKDNFEIASTFPDIWSSSKRPG